MEVVYEDNHIIIVNKQSGEIVQGDKTGDCPLSETVKEYIKVKYHKPRNVSPQRFQKKKQEKALLKYWPMC